MTKSLWYVTFNSKPMGMNWNSTTGEYTPVKSQEIKDLAVTVKTLKNRGMSVKDIAQTINRSVGRVYELLR